MFWKTTLVLCAALILSVGCRPQSAAPNPHATGAADVDKLIASHKGKVVLVNFWATWCGPCRIEIPAFVELQKRYGSQGLQIIGLSIDEGKTPADIEEFGRKQGINYPLLLVGADTVARWGNFAAIPMTYLLDTQGRKVWQQEGAAGVEEFEKQIKPLLPPAK